MPCAAASRNSYFIGYGRLLRVVKLLTREMAGSREGLTAGFHRVVQALRVGYRVARRSGCYPAAPRVDYPEEFLVFPVSLYDGWYSFAIPHQGNIETITG